MAMGKFHGVMMPTTPTGSRVMVHVDAGADARAATSPASRRRLAGEEVEDLRGADRLADALGERLALLAGELAADLLLAGEDLVAGRLLEDVVALLDAGLRAQVLKAAPSAAAIAAFGVGCLVPRDELRRGLSSVLDGLMLGDRVAGDPLAGDVVLVQFVIGYLANSWFGAGLERRRHRDRSVGIRAR
jgi:hypothetical protein